MAKLVTKFKYLKPNRKVSAGGYAKYIATREGVEKFDSSQKFASATEKQKHLIEKIIKDFPDSKDMFEYADYLEKQNQGSASDFISRVMEDYAYEISGIKAYAEYIATRPRAERFGSHGLFTDDGVQVQLSKLTEELDKHKGNIWTAIILFAEKMHNGLALIPELGGEICSAHRQKHLLKILKSQCKIFVGMQRFTTNPTTLTCI